jgi:hypothetical protein
MVFMRGRTGVMVVVLVAALAGAGVRAQSVMFGKRLIGKGDRVSLVREVAGMPDKLDRIDGDDSTPAMEIWTYTREQREVTVWIVSGKVVKVAEKTLTAPAG